jgi:glycosyltransferase involved in cell wall biosynthesis
MRNLAKIPGVAASKVSTVTSRQEKPQMTKSVATASPKPTATKSYSKSSSPAVSVIVPTYNVEPYLRQALDSLCNQTLQNIEIIVVNDGSKDNSLSIIKEYAKKDSRIIVIDKPNEGYGKSMNRGIDKATGQYIAILEPDDFLELNMFEDLYNIAIKNDLDIVKSDFNRFKGEGKQLVKEFFPCCSHKENYGKIINPAEHLEIFRYVMNTWCGIYKRDFLMRYKIRHNETPGASFQDNGFYFQTMCNAERLMFVNKAYYMNRRDNPNSSVKDKGKVYAPNVEYNWIRTIEKDNVRFNEKFGSVFFMRKFHTYKFTIQRISEEYHLEYIRSISKEFSEDYKQGRIDRKIVNPFEYHDIMWIIRDPDEYYYERVRNAIKVSVIVPVFNSEPYLKECLNSIVKQTLKDIEIIIVDDGSTDNSLNIVKAYAREDARITILTQNNKGAGAARNAGIDIARGQYLSFLDSDDIFDLNMLKEAYNKCKIDEAVICMFKVKRLDNATGNISSFHDGLQIDKLPKHRPFSINHIQNNPFTVTKAWPWNKLFKRTFIDNNNLRFQEIQSSNDMFFTFSAMLKAQRMTTVDKELVTYRVNNKTSIQNNLDKSWGCFYEVRSAIKNELNLMGNYKQFEKSFVNYFIISYVVYLKMLIGIDSKVAKQFIQRGVKQYFTEFEITNHSQGYFEDKATYRLYERIQKLGVENYEQLERELLS